MRHRTAAAVVAAAVLQGCSPPTAPPTPSPAASPADAGPGTVRWALQADPTSLDPRRIVTDDDALVVDALFDGLTALDDQLLPVPALARAWDVEDEARRFTFHLDPEATWHDGSPVVAADVVRGLQRVADGTASPGSLHHELLSDVDGYAAARQGGQLRGVVPLDDHTVQISTPRRTPELPALLAHPALAPVPPAAVEDPAVFAESPVGNGPFQLAEAWAHNQFVRLQASATHPDPAAAPELVFRVYAADTARSVQYADLLAGQLQVARVPLGARREARAQLGRAPITGGSGLHEGFLATTSLVLFDTRRPPFDDERARRAVSLLIDRDQLAARTDGARVAATGLVPPSLPDAQPASCVWCRHDPEAGGALLAEVLDELAAEGVELPPVVLQVSTDAVHGTLADQLSAALRLAGVEVRVVRAPTDGYLDSVTAEGASVLRLGWTAEEPSMRTWADDLLGVGSLGSELTGWSPQSLRDLVDRLRSTSTTAARDRVRQQIVRLALDEAVIAPVLFYRDDLLVADTLEGVLVDPFGGVDLTRLRLRSDDT